MVKGVNKTIIEVANTESKYFERILFIVNSEACSLGEKKLKQEAQNILKKYNIDSESYEPLRHMYIKRKEKRIRSVVLGCSILILAILSTIWLIL